MRTNFSIDDTEWQRKVREIPLNRRQKIKLVMEQTVQEAVDQITGYTSETSPPIRAGEGPRRQHAGGWADRTTNLRNSIGKAIDVDRGRIEATIGVGVGKGIIGVSVDDVLEYAVYLDMMEGINVLGGIPEQAFRKIVNNLKRVYHA